MRALLLAGLASVLQAGVIQKYDEYNRIYEGRIRAGSQLLHSLNFENPDLFVANDQLIIILFKIMDGLVPDFHHFRTFLQEEEIDKNSYFLKVFSIIHSYLDQGIQEERFTLEEAR